MLIAVIVPHDYRKCCIVNNAAQTIRRPPAYYRYLIELESQPIAQLAPQLQALIANPESGLG